MMDNPELTTQAPAFSFGIWDMIAASGFVVQIVLLVLVLFSIATWAIILFKWGSVKRNSNFSDQFLDVFWSGKSMDAIYSESKKLSDSALSKVFQAGYIELQRLIEKEKKKQTDPTLKTPQ